jgi:hypothetical protein
VTGPFSGIHGVKPTTSTEFSEPGYFAPGIATSALLNTNYVPRQVQFGLKLVF